MRPGGNRLASHDLVLRAGRRELAVADGRGQRAGVAHDVAPASARDGALRVVIAAADGGRRVGAIDADAEQRGHGFVPEIAWADGLAPGDAEHVTPRPREHGADDGREIAGDGEVVGEATVRRDLVAAPVLRIPHAARVPLLPRRGSGGSGGGL